MSKFVTDTVGSETDRVGVAVEAPLTLSTLYKLGDEQWTRVGKFSTSVLFREWCEVVGSDHSCEKQANAMSGVLARAISSDGGIPTSTDGRRYRLDVGERESEAMVDLRLKVSRRLVTNARDRAYFQYQQRGTRRFDGRWWVSLFCAYVCLLVKDEAVRMRLVREPTCIGSIISPAEVGLIFDSLWPFIRNRLVEIKLSQDDEIAKRRVGRSGSQHGNAIRRTPVSQKTQLKPVGPITPPVVCDARGIPSQETMVSTMGSNSIETGTERQRALGICQQADRQAPLIAGRIKASVDFSGLRGSRASYALWLEQVLSNLSTPREARRYYNRLRARARGASGNPPRSSGRPHDVWYHLVEPFPSAGRRTGNQPQEAQKPSADELYLRAMSAVCYHSNRLPARQCALLMDTLDAAAQLCPGPNAEETLVDVLFELLDEPSL